MYRNHWNSFSKKPPIHISPEISSKSVIILVENCRRERGYLGQNRKNSLWAEISFKFSKINLYILVPCCSPFFVSRLCSAQAAVFYAKSPVPISPTNRHLHSTVVDCEVTKKQKKKRKVHFECKLKGLFVDVTLKTNFKQFKSF